MNIDNNLKYHKIHPVKITGCDIEVYVLTKNQLLSIVEYKYDVDNFYDIGLNIHTLGYLRHFENDLPVSLQKLSLMHHCGMVTIWDFINQCLSNLNDSYFVNDLSEKKLHRLGRYFNQFSNTHNVNDKTKDFYKSYCL